MNESFFGGRPGHGKIDTTALSNEISNFSIDIIGKIEDKEQFARYDLTQSREMERIVSGIKEKIDEFDTKTGNVTAETDISEVSATIEVTENPSFDFSFGLLKGEEGFSGSAENIFVENHILIL